MASRPIFTPYSVITNGDMSASITSAVTILTNLSKISYSCTWAGTTPVGAVTVQVSDDYSQNGQGTVLNAGTWNDLPLSATCSVSGNTGNGGIDIASISFYAIRLVYTRASGIGTFNCLISGKAA